MISGYGAAAGGAQAEAREMADERGDTGKGDW